MNIYIAAKYSYRAQVRQLAGEIVKQGHYITARWVYSEDEEPLDQSEVDPMVAWHDLEDIDAADMVVLLQLPFASNEPDASVGRHFETGYAFAQHKRIFVVGKRTSIFHYLAGIRFFDTFEELVGQL